MTTLAVDLDGVLANFVYGFTRYVREIGAWKFTSDYQPMAWDFPEIPDRALFQRAISTFHEQHLFWQSLPAYVANCNSLAEFIGKRPEVNIVYLTARPSPSKGPSALVQTNRWLRAQGLLGDATTVIVVDNWQRKVDTVAILGVDAIIDDHSQTVEGVLKLALTTWGSLMVNATLLSRPWNKDADLPRVDTLKMWLDSIK